MGTRGETTGGARCGGTERGESGRADVGGGGWPNDNRSIKDDEPTGAVATKLYRKTDRRQKERRRHCPHRRRTSRRQATVALLWVRAALAEVDQLFRQRLQKHKRVCVQVMRRSGSGGGGGPSSTIVRGLGLLPPAAQKEDAEQKKKKECNCTFAFGVSRLCVSSFGDVGMLFVGFGFGAFVLFIFRRRFFAAQSEIGRLKHCFSKFLKTLTVWELCFSVQRERWTQQ